MKEIIESYHLNTVKEYINKAYAEIHNVNNGSLEEANQLLLRARALINTVHLQILTHLQEKVVK